MTEVLQLAVTWEDDVHTDTEFTPAEWERFAEDHEWRDRTTVVAFFVAAHDAWWCRRHLDELVEFLDRIRERQADQQDVAR